MLQPDDFIVNDSNIPDGKRGLIPRDYSANPLGSYEGSTVFGALNEELPLIDWQEMPDRIAEKVANKSQLSDIRNRGDNGRPIKSLDQNGQGYCWMYSGTMAAMLLRAKANMPHVRLSGHAGACIIKNFRDQGGWGAAGLDRLMSHGQPSIEFWPEKSMRREHDNPRTWENAALHKVLEGWIEIEAAQYDRNLSFQQTLTSLLYDIPVIGDYNHWGHSVCLMDAVDVYPNKRATDPGRYGVRLINSWTDNWGNNGTGVLTDRKAVPDGATAPRSITLSDI
jgi:hypothetical protein